MAHTRRPAHPWLLPVLLALWALTSFALPLVAAHLLPAAWAYGVTALGGPLGFLGIVAACARVQNQRRRP